MASDKLDFEWGDIVIIEQTAPQQYKPGSKGCICGIRTIDSQEAAQEFNQKIDSELYLIEFDNGESLEVPKIYLSF